METFKEYLTNKKIEHIGLKILILNIIYAFFYIIYFTNNSEFDLIVFIIHNLIPFIITMFFILNFFITFKDKETLIKEYYRYKNELNKQYYNELKKEKLKQKYEKIYKKLIK